MLNTLITHSPELCSRFVGCAVFTRLLKGWFRVPHCVCYSLVHRPLQPSFFAVCKYGGGRQSMEVVKAWPGNGDGVCRLLGVRTSLTLAFPLQGASAGPEPAE